MATVNPAPVIVAKFGEVTSIKMFKVRGDPHWVSSPTEALQIHNRLVAFANKGGFAKKDVKK
jgi:hypothetical protein